MLDCSIVIGERSILLNIIAPLIDMKHSAMQENVWSNAEIDSWQQHFANIPHLDGMLKHRRKIAYFSDHPNVIPF